MGKIILIILFFNVTLLNANAQIKTLNNLVPEKIETAKPDSTKSNKTFSHQSLSLGCGLFYGFDELKNRYFVISISTSIHFSKIFHTDINYNYINYNYSKIGDSESEGHILSLIPQISFNLYKDKIRLYTGIGEGLIAQQYFGFFFLTGDVKIEYNINKWFSINTETVFHPLMQKFNLGFNLPY
jgi:hypothetical protein